MEQSTLFLTKPTDYLMVPSRQLHRTSKLAESLKDSGEYWRGRGTRDTRGLPLNIICFSRTRRAQLAAYIAPPSQHHRFVLIAALNGLGHVCVDEKRFLLAEGQVQLICPFQFHTYVIAGSEPICWAFLTFELDDQAGLDKLRSSPSRDLGEVEIVLLREILANWRKRGPVRVLQFQLAALLARLCGIGRVLPHRKDARETDGAEADFLTRVNGHVIACLDNARSISLKGLSADLGQSESSLRTRFRAATGMSLGRHLRNLRLTRAGSLLHSTSLSVSEVSEHC